MTTDSVAMTGANASTLQAQPAHASAMARHISEDGCQLVLEAESLAQGQRVSFALEGGCVRATVRWIVQDRAGVAFDAPLSAAQQALMVGSSRALQRLDLYAA
ncbi:PilZ domain-containing protein [Novosphingobium sp. Leaf2]|uniref:PilZ domain-containing protein n=1 Tax=Novosphingobium sp. Leaf2 TaxID=1735670 RepID=UPI001F385CA6|nr:PilZ domain-containing protein [Novosphingobium sp. Leaf2]